MEFENDFEQTIELLTLSQENVFKRLNEYSPEISHDQAIKLSKMFQSGKPQVSQEFLEYLKEVNGEAYEEETKRNQRDEPSQER